MVYLPPGTYVVNDTLVNWFHTELVGSAACPTTIRLAPSSPGFATRAAAPSDGFSGLWLKPVLVFQGGFNTRTSSHAWWSDRSPRDSPWCTNNTMTCGDGMNMNFYNMIRNIDIVVGAGNPGAIGLMWNVAQQTSIRNVTIDLTQSGAIGLDVSGSGDALAYHMYGGGGDQGGGGTIEDVRILGGVIGMRAKGSQWTFRSIHMSGARDIGLFLTQTWSFAVLDLQIASVPVAVKMTRNQASLFVDCRFNDITGPATMVGDDRTQVRHSCC